MIEEFITGRLTGVDPAGQVGPVEPLSCEGGGIPMRLKDVVRFSTLGVFVVALTLGCDQTKVEVAPAPAQQSLPKQAVPKERTKGGGPGSSGNINRNPFDPLKPP